VLAGQAFVVVADAGDATTAARLAAERAPTVIITDLCLPDVRGAAVVARLLTAQADARIIVLTALADEETVAAAVLAGAQGYVLKSQPAAALIQAVRTVAQGGAAFDPLIVPAIWRRFTQLIQAEGCAAGHPEALSPTECDVLRDLARGQTTRQIAAALEFTPAAVERVVAEVCEKLHARNRTEAAVIALKRGLISAH
jgi:DNA-binding NarL/FixJ family response regulator